MRDLLTAVTSALQRFNLRCWKRPGIQNNESNEGHQRVAPGSSVTDLDGSWGKPGGTLRKGSPTVRLNQGIGPETRGWSTPSDGGCQAAQHRYSFFQLGEYADHQVQTFTRTLGASHVFLIARRNHHQFAEVA
jgi:hypothetical protein